MSALKQYLPDLHEIFADAEKSFYSSDEEDAIKRAYSLCKSISIDYGVMEKAENVYVILAGFKWSDLGTWKSLYNELPKDENRNVLLGNTITYNSYNCMVKTPHEKLVVLQGLQDCIVAEYDNVLLICRKEDEQKVKDFVADAKNKGAEFI
jgi:mannose-1-phosphate guanylyltransferase